MNPTKEQSNYNDMFYLPHHISKTHSQMTLLSRAAQFAPFAALTGHDAAIKETARLTDEQLELNEDHKEKINECLTELAKLIHLSPQITLVYFIPDKKKAGGFYQEYTGHLKKIDLYNRVLIMKDGIRIQIDRIVDLTKKAPYNT